MNHSSMTGIMLKALWVAFKWPLAVFLLFIFFRAMIAPIWQAIVRTLKR